MSEEGKCCGGARSQDAETLRRTWSFNGTDGRPCFVRVQDAMGKLQRDVFRLDERATSVSFEVLATDSWCWSYNKEWLSDAPCNTPLSMEDEGPYLVPGD